MGLFILCLKFPNFFCIIKMNTFIIVRQTQIKSLKTKEKKECLYMSKNNIVVPEAREAMDRFKMEAAAEVGVNLKQGYNGDLTSKQAGSVGGQMVKKMIEQYEQSAK